MKIGDLLEEIRDMIFPALIPMRQDQLARIQESENTQLAFVESHTDPAALSEGYEKLHEYEMERLRSVESRLGGILSLTSITASILLSGVFALVNGGLSDSDWRLRLAAAGALLYLNLQVVCSTIAVIRGLKRSTWQSLSLDDLVPQPGVGPIEFNRQVARHHCKRLLKAEQNINHKVSQMDVAHTAIRNFAVGSALIAALGVAAVGLQHPGSAAARAIRNDSEIQMLLKGPQGNPGPQGPPGPRGLQGEPGQPSASH